MKTKVTAVRLVSSLCYCGWSQWRGPQDLCMSPWPNQGDELSCTVDVQLSELGVVEAPLYPSSGLLVIDLDCLLAISLLTNVTAL